MRKLAFLLMALMLIVLSACSSSSTTVNESDNNGAEMTASENGGSGGGTLVVDLVAEPVSMDPAQVTDVNSNRVHYNVFDTLVGWNKEGFKLEPRLAKEWNVSVDGKEYTFFLREGVKFHDGTPVNAKAVKFTFERMLDKNHPYHNTGPFPFADSYYGVIDKIEAVDELTVKFHLKNEYGPFLNNLTATVGGIVSPAAVEKYGEDFALHGVGSGPFILEDWKKGISLTVKANKDYWGGSPKVDRVVFEPVTEDLVRVTKLQTGEADIIADVNPDSIEQLLQSANVLQQAGPHIWYVAFNMAEPPFDDIRVRRAVSHAIDKESIVNNILKGTGVPANQPLAPVFDGYNKDIQGYEYNPDKARQLLADAGYGDGLTVKFVIPESGSGMQSPVPMSTAIQGYLKEVGITAEITKMEWGAFLNEVNPGAEGKHHMWVLSWMTVTGDPDMPLTNLFSANSIPMFNSGYYRNEEVTTMLDEARYTTNLSKRADLYRKVEKLIVDDAPFVFVDWAKQTAATTKEVKGFQLHPSHMFDLKDVSK